MKVTIIVNETLPPGLAGDNGTIRTLTGSLPLL